MKGWPVVKVYSDEGISGTLSVDKRPGLKTLLEDGEKGMFNVVIFYSLDRLGRTTAIVLKTIESLTNMDIKIVSCKESIDTSSPTGLFILTIFAALAQLERDTIVNRMADGKAERVKKDGEGGGRLPYGYARINGKVGVNKDEAVVVNNIFYGYCVNNISITNLAKILNDHEIKAPRGDVWHETTIYKILQKRNKYEGGFRNDSPVRWPRILTHDYPVRDKK